MSERIYENDEMLENNSVKSPLERETDVDFKSVLEVPTQGLDPESRWDNVGPDAVPLETGDRNLMAQMNADTPYEVSIYQYQDENALTHTECQSPYLGNFEYDPNQFTIGYKDVGTDKLPVFAYTGDLQHDWQHGDRSPAQLAMNGEEGYMEAFGSNAAGFGNAAINAVDFLGIIPDNPIPNENGWTRAQQVEIPQGVKILDYTFENNQELQLIPGIPDSVESMHCAFKGCERLHGGSDEFMKDGTWVFPDNMTDISYAFQDCKNLTGYELRNFQFGTEAEEGRSLDNKMVGMFSGCDRFMQERETMAFRDKYGPVAGLGVLVPGLGVAAASGAEPKIQSMTDGRIWDLNETKDVIFAKPEDSPGAMYERHLEVSDFEKNQGGTLTHGVNPVFTYPFASEPSAEQMMDYSKVCYMHGKDDMMAGPLELNDQPFNLQTAKDSFATMMQQHTDGFEQRIADAATPLDRNMAVRDLRTYYGRIATGLEDYNRGAMRGYDEMMDVTDNLDTLDLANQNRATLGVMNQSAVQATMESMYRMDSKYHFVDMTDLERLDSIQLEGVSSWSDYYNQAADKDLAKDLQLDLEEPVRVDPSLIAPSLSDAKFAGMVGKPGMYGMTTLPDRPSDKSVNESLETLPDRDPSASKKLTPLKEGGLMADIAGKVSELAQKGAETVQKAGKQLADSVQRGFESAQEFGKQLTKDVQEKMPSVQAIGKQAGSFFGIVPQDEQKEVPAVDLKKREERVKQAESLSQGVEDSVGRGEKFDALEK